MKNVKQQLYTLFLLVMLGGACIPQAPVRVLVTPTLPDASTTSVPPTLDPATIAPSATTEITAEATVEVTAVEQAAVGSPTPTFIGALVGPSYTPPVPTATPTTGPTLPPDAVATATTPPDTNVGPTATPLPLLDASRMGVQIDPNVTNDGWIYIMDRVSQLGVGWIKIQFNWNFYQSNSPDEWSDAMQRIELYLFEANRRGINVMLSIAKAPAWSRTTDVEDGPPDDPQVFANFLSLLFSGGPQEYNLMEQVDAIEVWNEPNLVREWQGQPMTGAAYMTYFDAAYRAIRAANATIPIVTAGLAPTSDSDVSRDDRAYLREMYAAGLGNYSDVHIGVHPFSWANAPDAVCCNAVEGEGWDDDPHFFFMDTINEYRTIMNENGHTNAQMWFTEFGWATWERFTSPVSQEWMSYTNEIEQGQNIVRAFEIGQQRGDIGVMMLWNLNFANETLVNSSNELAGYSIMPYVQLRPAFCMLTDALRPLDQRTNDYSACQ